jgi:hypothetical protein
MGHELSRDGLKLGWSSDKVLPDLIGEVNDSDEIANAEAEAHFNERIFRLLTWASFCNIWVAIRG